MELGLWEEPRRLTRFWDSEGFTSAEGIKAITQQMMTADTSPVPPEGFLGGKINLCSAGPWLRLDLPV